MTRRFEVGLQCATRHSTAHVPSRLSSARVGCRAGDQHNNLDVVRRRTSQASRSMAKIVVGVDGSASSNAALRWALDEARLRGIPLEAVHAFALPQVSTTSQALHLIETEFASYRAAGAEILDRALSEAGAAAEPIEIERSVVEGPPTAALLGAVTEDDLLVVGSRGRGGFAGLLLGSVSEQVAQHAPCPVVIVR